MTEKEYWDYLSKKQDKRNLISSLFDKFTESIIPELKKKSTTATQKKENVYQISGATKLSIANTITRTYSTELGLLWEKIANLSPNVISPELDFHFKIPEVDIIVSYEDHLYYTQLKTQKNTLTGSQNPRTVAELSRYPYSWFVACINTEANWTYKQKSNRLVGDEFWSKININYEQDILPNLKKSILKVEKAFMK